MYFTRTTLLNHSTHFIQKSQSMRTKRSFHKRHIYRGNVCSGSMRLNQRVLSSSFERNLLRDRVSGKRFYSQTQEVDFEPVTELDPGSLQSFISIKDRPVFLEIYRPEDKMSFTHLRNAIAQENGDALLGRIQYNNINPQSISQLKIVSTPCVLVFFEGRMYPKRMMPNFGPEMQDETLEQVMQQFYSMESVPKHEEAVKALKDKDLDKAANIWKDLLQVKKFRFAPYCIAGLAAVSFERGDVQSANELIDALKEQYPQQLSDVFINSVISKISLGELAIGDISEADLLKKIEENPKDIEALYQLGVVYYSQSDYENSISYLLKSIRQDINWNEKAAYTMVMKIFDHLGPNDPLTIKGRRRLGNYVY
eukprot:TRINITY_DN384_c0_g1_i1.p1 TRINITY_DN384_c0_g1~~TRINITY_DN384_c0_g1_i1.p1  ORF type:complete len:367 (+),score=80.28 TRINITY_DN384_c0_g1_i1:180-1280(+)